jgi:RNA-directed DNA polymerase
MRGNSLQVNLINWIKENMEIHAHGISWKATPWKKFKIRTFRLQCRIYKAMRNGDIRYVIKLQKILINSSAAHYTAVKEITSQNIIHKVIDGERAIFLKYAEKRNAWDHYNGQKIPITKLKEDTKVFQKWTTKDRIAKYIWKMALEPAHEAIFCCDSYGCRPGKNPWDLQRAISIWVSNLSPSLKAKVLKIEIHDCFDKINHNFIMKKLILPQKNKIGIFQNLKAGLLDKNVFNSHRKIKKGILEPLLGNIALHGIENLNESKSFPKQILKSKCDLSKGFRYANNVVYILEENENEDMLIGRVKKFLKTRNLELKIEKLEITKVLDGFNLLEWRFMITTKGNLVSYPSRYHWINYKTKVKSILKNSKYKIQTRIDRVRIVVQEWHIYHQFCDMTQVKSQLYELKIWYSKYIRSYTKIPKEERILTLQRIFNNHSYKVFGYSKILRGKSPFDGGLTYRRNNTNLSKNSFTFKSYKNSGSHLMR